MSVFIGRATWFPCPVIQQESINSEYSNANKVCKEHNKKFNDWRHLDTTQEYLKIVSANVSVPVSRLIQIKKGGVQEQQGVWVHPYVAINLTQWLSPLASVKVTTWIDEWRSYSLENEERFLDTFTDMRPSKTFMLKKIKDDLRDSLNVEVDVETPTGTIDLVTTHEIIEIKEVRHWKYAIGQILSNSVLYPKKQKVLYLFGDSPYTEHIMEHIMEVCDRCDIRAVCGDIEHVSGFIEQICR